MIGGLRRVEGGSRVAEVREKDAGIGACLLQISSSKHGHHLHPGCGMSANNPSAVPCHAPIRPTTPRSTSPFRGLPFKRTVGQRKAQHSDKCYRRRCPIGLASHFVEKLIDAPESLQPPLVTVAAGRRNHARARQGVQARRAGTLHVPEGSRRCRRGAGRPDQDLPMTCLWVCAALPHRQHAGAR